MTGSRVERMSLLILYVEWLGIEHQDFGRCEQGIALLGVVVIKQLESGELHRLGFDVSAVRVVFHPRVSPTAHVYHDLNARIELNRLWVGEHLSRRAADDQHP